MFVLILKSPKTESSTRDIGLLDLAAGYFGYLDYATEATISFPFVRSLGSWARLVFSRAEDNDSRGGNGWENSGIGMPSDALSLPVAVMQPRGQPPQELTNHHDVGMNTLYDVRISLYLPACQLLSLPQLTCTNPQHVQIDNFGFGNIDFNSWPSFLPHFFTICSELNLIPLSLCLYESRIVTLRNSDLYKHFPRPRSLWVNLH